MAVPEYSRNGHFIHYSINFYKSNLPKIRHFGPCGNKVFYKFVLSIKASVYFCNCSQFCIGTENKIGAGSCPFWLTGGTVSS